MNWEDTDQRAELDAHAAEVDILVLTAQISLEQSFRWNEPGAYGHRFACAVLEANPDAAIYVYESWHNLEAASETGDYGPPQRWDWRRRLNEDRQRWLRLVDEIYAGHGVASGCEVPPIHIVPVGRAYGMIVDELEDEVEPWHLFQNPHQGWPAEWPLQGVGAYFTDAEARLSEIPLVDPDRPVDDIHSSSLGVYIVALTHCATLFRESPVGLPAANGVDPDLARRLQEVVWEAVLTEPRSGVLASQ